jgi:preprotein translocase subunit SecB
MSDPKPSGESTQESTQQFVLQKIYIKDISFETPNSPEIFTTKWEPNINIELHTNANKLSDDVHEVTLGVTLTAKIDDKVAYLIEIKQAGLFTISGFPKKEFGAMLGAYCPNLLFPFAREAISDLVVKGGFPQMLLVPVNFDAIYAEHLARQKTKPETESEKPKSIH